MDKPILKRGFTLIELLVVVAIIGVLVSVGVVSYSSVQKKSRDSRRREDMKAVQAGWEQYYMDNDATYPPSGCAISTTYLPEGLPQDPKDSSPYVYTKTCTTSTYCFCARMEAGTGNATNTTCSYGSGTYYCVSNLQ